MAAVESDGGFQNQEHVISGAANLSNRVTDSVRIGKRVIDGCTALSLVASDCHPAVPRNLHPILDEDFICGAGAAYSYRKVIGILV